MKINFKKTSIVLISIFAFLFSATATVIVVKGLRDDIQVSDVGVILGSKVNVDGNPSARLVARLEKGRELYAQGIFKHIIVSGGVGKEGYDEAQVMKQYLVTHHVPESAIILDNQGITSEATAQNTEWIMRQHHFTSALIVSQYFHIVRAQVAFEKYHINPVYHAHANYIEWRDLYSIPREVVGYYVYRFRG
jgi:vancomycin permeability regulator SanA